MHRRIIASFLILLYFMAEMQPFYPLIIYHTDYHYIVTHLCINRNKPWLHCDGKCFLRKRLNKVFNHHSHNPEQAGFSRVKLKECLPVDDPLLLFQHNTSPSSIDPVIYRINYQFKFYQKLLRPPQFA